MLLCDVFLDRDQLQRDQLWQLQDLAQSFAGFLHLRSDRCYEPTDDCQKSKTRESLATDHYVCYLDNQYILVHLRKRHLLPEQR